MILRLEDGSGGHLPAHTGEPFPGELCRHQRAAPEYALVDEVDLSRRLSKPIHEAFRGRVGLILILLAQ
jgi:hypothetical protein